jgi:hypothetical protein
MKKYQFLKQLYARGLVSSTTLDALGEHIREPISQEEFFNLLIDHVDLDMEEAKKKETKKKTAKKSIPVK